MRLKEESEKVGLKLNIQKTKIMASGPITSWEIDGETVETVCIPYFEGRHKLIPVMAKMLCKRKQLLLQVQNSASILSLLEA